MTTSGSATADDDRARRTLTEYRVSERVDACPLCASPRRESVDQHASVVRCRACGHRYVDPRPTQEEVARGYSEPTAYDDWISAAGARQAMWQRRFDLVLGGRPTGRLLDVGAGIGTFLAIARDHGWAVEGTEVSTTAITRAWELNAIAIRPGTLERAAPPGPYDVISLWHVLEHVPDPPGTLRVCHALLRDGGTIILAMPNDGDAAWSLTALGNLVRRVLGRPPAARYEQLRPGVESHIQHFSRDAVKGLLAEAGFTVERIDVDDASPERRWPGGLAFAARRMLTRLTPWNVGREMLFVAFRGSERT